MDFGVEVCVSLDFVCLGFLLLFVCFCWTLRLDVIFIFDIVFVVVFGCGFEAFCLFLCWTLRFFALLLDFLLDALDAFLLLFDLGYSFL